MDEIAVVAKRDRNSFFSAADKVQQYHNNEETLKNEINTWHRTSEQQN